MDSEYVDIADTRTRFEAFGHGLGIILAAFAVGIGFGLVGLSLFAPVITVRAPDGTLTPVASALSAVFQFIGFIVTAVGYLRWRENDSLITVRIPSLRDTALVIGGFVSIVITSLVLGAVIRFLGLETAQNSVIATGKQNPEYFLYMIPITLVFVAPGEEIVFRGVVQGLFKRAYGPLPAILISSILFGVAHYFALISSGGQGKVVYIAIAAVLGIILGTAYEMSDNIVVPTLIHGIWNSFLFLGQWVVATYDVQQLLLVAPK